MKLSELARVLHWGPLIALTIIFSIYLGSSMCVFMWWPLDTWDGLAHYTVFTMWLYLILYYFFSAMYGGPGYVPNGWKPEKVEDIKYLQYCQVCDGYKAPRSHHCRKCNRCVLKMDHHCPWINHCCGHRNHRSFTLFLFFAPVGCIHALVILLTCIYRAVNFNYYYLSFGSRNLVYFGVWGFLGVIFCVGLAIGVILAVGGLWIVQMRSIMKNETGIESWICEKAYYRERELDETEEFIYPYNLGRWRNLCQVLTWSGRPVGDGITWTVVDGCDQYTLTVEQMKQKADKRERARQYIIAVPATGSWFPLSMGIRVCCSPPCSDEPRIKLEVGDHVLVTRWKKHWLYGDRMISEGKQRWTTGKGSSREKGWFPRLCARELIYNGHNPGDHQKTS